MNDSIMSSVLRARKQELQYLLAGAISLAFVGATMLYPEFAGIEGTTGYLWIGYLLTYAIHGARSLAGRRSALVAGIIVVVPILSAVSNLL